MRRWLHILALLFALLWSLMAWGTYALLNAAGSFIAGNADWVTDHPETVVWLSWLVSFATGLGLTGVMIL